MNIICPDCGYRLTINRFEEFNSYPPQYMVTCNECGYYKYVPCSEVDKKEVSR